MLSSHFAIALVFAFLIGCIFDVLGLYISIIQTRKNHKTIGQIFYFIMLVGEKLIYCSILLIKPTFFVFIMELLIKLYMV